MLAFFSFFFLENSAIVAQDRIQIEIKDDGVGIEKEILEKIVDPFFTTKDPGTGSGLGLSIAHSIVERHHGKMKFDSQKGKGTTVTLTFPTA